MTKFFRKLDALVALAEDVGCVATYAVIVCIVVAHVFFRYVLVSGILWSDELVQILLVYMVMFGSARAIRTNGHTELNSLGDKLPAMPRYVLRTAIVIACIGFFLLFFIGAAEYVANAGRLRTVVLRIPRAYCYFSLALGSALMLYEFLKTIKRRIARIPGEEQA